MTEHVFAYNMETEQLFAIMRGKEGAYMFAGFDKGEFIQMALGAVFMLGLGYAFTFAVLLLF